MQVADRVWNIGDRLTNFYAIEEGGRLTLVDGGNPADAAELGARLARIGFKPTDVEAILLTHAHGDHIGCAETVRRDGGRVHVHRQELELATGRRRGKGERSLVPYLASVTAWRTMIGFSRRGFRTPVPVAEAATFGDGEAIDVPGRPRAIHTPGHTPGSACFLFEDRDVVLTGDALVTFGILKSVTGPRVAPGAFNESNAGAVASLDAIGRSGAGTVLPGHGEPFRDGAGEAARIARAIGAW